MADIKRNMTDLLAGDSDLQHQHLKIMLNERQSKINALKLRLQDLVNIEQKKIEFQINLEEKAIKDLEVKMAKFENNENLIDVEADTKKD